MSSRLVRGITATLGAAALMTAYYTQGVTLPMASTVTAGVHAATAPKPFPFGLALPSTSPQPQSAPTQDNTEAYDYISPCSLVPLSEIHEITGDQRLLYVANGQDSRLTNEPGDAHASEDIEDPGQYNCFLTTDLNIVKVQLMISVTPDVQRAVFDIGYRQQNLDDNTVMWAERVSTKGLPGADSAYLTYAYVRGERLYQGLFVHTKDGQALEVLRANKRELRKLAVAALRTLNGSRYPGK